MPAPSPAPASLVEPNDAGPQPPVGQGSRRRGVLPGPLPGRAPPPQLPSRVLAIRRCPVRVGDETPRTEGTHMPRIVAVVSLTLDGVVQAPGRPDEDTRGGFPHGGWAVPHTDEVMAKAMGARMSRDGVLLLGRRTYDDLYGYWPK